MARSNRTRPGKGQTKMDVQIARDADSRTQRPAAVYEPPMLDEVGGFTALTRLDPEGTIYDRFGYVKNAGG